MKKIMDDIIKKQNGVFYTEVKNPFNPNEKMGDNNNFWDLSDRCEVIRVRLDEIEVVKDGVGKEMESGERSQEQKEDYRKIYNQVKEEKIELEKEKKKLVEMMNKLS